MGDERQHSCMLSKYKDSPSDHALLESYKINKVKFHEYSFLNRGSDERQYNSPGIDLGITSIFRSKYGTYPEYHTSLDDFNFVTLNGVKGGFQIAKKAIYILNNKIFPKNNILCEPNLGKRKMYPTLSTKRKINSAKIYLSFMQFSDGKNSIEQISKNIKVNLSKTFKIYGKLLKKKLIY